MKEGRGRALRNGGAHPSYGAIQLLVLCNAGNLNFAYAYGLVLFIPSVIQSVMSMVDGRAWNSEVGGSTPPTLTNMR